MRGPVAIVAYLLGTFTCHSLNWARESRDAFLTSIGITDHTLFNAVEMINRTLLSKQYLADAWYVELYLATMMILTLTFLWRWVNMNVQ